MEIKTIDGQKTLCIRQTVKPDEIGPTLDRIFPEIWQYASSQNLQITGPPYARTYSITDTSVDLEGGMPVTDPGAGNGRIVPAELPGGKAVSAIHMGSYDKLCNAYEAATAWIAERKLEKSGAPWETYLNDPRETPEAEWKTQLLFPVQ
ncbi:MAG: AraC family transcriptional regulator [Chlorobi bacterium]|nr:AraC family transcriptional regulator [Chlorobiota bacterium]